METGATRNFEPWRAADEALDDAKKKRDAEEMGDAMKALENRTIDSKQEMDILAALDEMKSMRARHVTVGTEAMLQALKQTQEQKEKELDEEDEAVLRSIVFHNSSTYVRRLDDDEDEDGDGGGDVATIVSKKRKRRPDAQAGDQKDPLVDHVSEDVVQGQEIKSNSKPGPAFVVRPKFAVQPKAKTTATVALGESMGISGGERIN